MTTTIDHQALDHKTVDQKKLAQANLYDQDQNLWLELTIAQLRSGDLQNLDLENLIEELEGLSGSNKREIETRLIRLIEHLLKRCYVKLPECYRGWEVTKVNSGLTKIFITNFFPSPCIIWLLIIWASRFMGTIPQWQRCKG